MQTKRQYITHTKGQWRFISPYLIHTVILIRWWKSHQLIASFTHSLVVPNQFFSSVKHNRKDILKNVGNQTADLIVLSIFLNSIFFPTMEVNGYHQLFDYSSKYLVLCSTEERNSYRVGTTWEWINGFNLSNFVMCFCHFF